MSEQRHDSGSLTLTEEDLGVDAVEAEATGDVQVDAAPASEGGESADQRLKKLRRTVRIPDDEVARPSRPPPPAVEPPQNAAQPIMGQRIIAIGAGLPPPPRPPSVPPTPLRVPSEPPPIAVVDRDEIAGIAGAPEDAGDEHGAESEPPITDPGMRSVPAPSVAAKVQDDSWTPYQPRVASEPPPAPPRLVSPLVGASAAPSPWAPAAHAASVANLPPSSQRRPSVQFEAPPVWARPPGRPPSDSRPDGMRAPADSRPSYGSSPGIASASSSVIDLATPTPGQPWPPRDSIVDVAVDFESDVTLLDVGLPAPRHARSTRVDEFEVVDKPTSGYVPESDLSSSHLDVDAPSGELDAPPPSVEEVDIDPEPDSDSSARLGGVLLAAEDLSALPPAPPPPAKQGEKAAPPAPKLAAPNLLGLGNLAPLPLTDAASQRKKSKPWWEELFNDDFVRTGAKGVKEDYKAEVDFIEDSLGMEKGATILDLACGTGRHAIELSKRGYRMVGFDLSLAMLARAADLAQAEDQRINFVQGDMREMQFEEAFDGVYSWNTSFGYFEEDKNAQVAQLVHKALRKGGQFLLDIVNRDYIIQESPTVAWFEGDACICMDEMHIDWITSRMRVKRTIMFDDGRSRELEYSVRLYSLHELGRLLHEAGFRVTEVSGLLSTPGVFFGCQSPRTLILAEKR